LPISNHVVITGASGGIGRALAEHFAAPGRLLSLTGRDQARLDAAVDACRAKGAEVRLALLDVVDARSLGDWLLAIDRERPIDVLIANAGIGGSAAMPSGAGEAGPLANEILAVNMAGVINTVTPVLPLMLARGAGHLALVSSLAGYLGLPQSPVYSASKAAVRIYGDALRRRARRHGVYVTNIMPGFVDTPMSQSLATGRPFCWSAERAARHIAAAIDRGAAQSVFPWQLRLAIAAQSLLPMGLSDFILARSLPSDRQK
jgi:short-subunit dehydrogenase